MFENELPSDVPGFDRFEQRQAAVRKMLNDIHFKGTENIFVHRALMGKGCWMQGPFEEVFSEARVCRESAVDAGLQFIRRSYAGGLHYFFVNRGGRAVNEWITLAKPARSAVLMDPCFEDRVGLAALRKTDDGQTQVYLQLQPGQSCILRTFTDQVVVGPAWVYFRKGGSPQTLEGTWDIKFIEGGPALPKAYQTKKLESWTKQNDPNAQRFAGTAQYTIEFELTDVKAEDWLLDLGRVCDSARVRINGQSLGTLWCAPFQIRMGQLLRLGKNILNIEITNLAANRIRDLDSRKVNWKYFYDANVVNVDYKPFDASNWPLRDSGLLGPVSLTPLEKMSF